MVGLIFTHRMAEGRETSRTIANERPVEAVLDHRGAIVVVVNVLQTRKWKLIFDCFFFVFFEKKNVQKKLKRRQKKSNPHKKKALLERKTLRENAREMVARRVPLLTKIVLSVVEDALTFVTTVAACAVACGARSIGFILKRPHVFPVLSTKAREREYEELGERLLEETRKEEEEDDALDANLRRISMEFAIPRTPNGIEKAREIRFVDEMDEENEGEERSLKLVSEFGMSANIFLPENFSSSSSSSSSAPEDTVILLNPTGGTQETFLESGIVACFCEKLNCSVLTLDMRGQGTATDTVDFDSLRVLAMDVLAVLRTIQEDKKKYKIGSKTHIVGYSIGAGVAMWIGILLSPRRRGALTYPKIDSISLYGFTSKGVISGKPFMGRVLARAFATEMFVRTCGIRGFVRLIRLACKPNYEALDGQKLKGADLAHHTCETNTLDGFVYQVKSWTTFSLSPDELKSIEIPTLILHAKRDELAGHTRDNKLSDAETMPRGEFLEVEGDYSHLFPFENPELFVKTTSEFIRNRVSARRL